MPGVPTANLESWMAPLPPPCLGRFCSGYHIADAPSRVACVRSLLEISGLVSGQVAAESNVSKALGSVFQHAPHLISRAKEPLATAQPLPLLGSDKDSCPCAVCWPCRGRRWLANVPLRSEVGALGTIPCRTHDAGNWQIAWARSGAAVLPLQNCSCWGLVLEKMLGKAAVPRRVSSSDLLSCPVVCSSMVLFYSTGGVGRCFVGLLVALQGTWSMSLTAATFMYQRLWVHTLQDTMYARRPNFVSRTVLSC